MGRWMGRWVGNRWTYVMKGERGEKERQKEKNTSIADSIGATYTCGGSSKKLTPW